jgi:hypothetical protein
MHFAAAFLLAAAAVQAAPADAPEGAGRGAQVESARVSVTIKRAAVLRHGALLVGPDDTAPRGHRQSRAGRVTYEVE